MSNNCYSYRINLCNKKPLKSKTDVFSVYNTIASKTNGFHSIFLHKGAFYQMENDSGSIECAYCAIDSKRRIRDKEMGMKERQGTNNKTYKGI